MRRMTVDRVAARPDPSQVDRGLYTGARHGPDAPAGRKTACSTSRLHNMSAPPRSVVELRPLRGGTAQPGSGRTGRDREPKGIARGPTARLFARVCLVGLLHDGNAARPRSRDAARRRPGPPPDLAAAVATLRTGSLDGWPGETALAREWQTCRAMSPEDLHDELLERLAGLGPLDLPPLLIVRPVEMAIPAPRGPTPLQAMRLLAGTDGALFLRARAPSAGFFLSGAPGAAGIACQFDYWLPAAAEV